MAASNSNSVTRENNHSHHHQSREYCLRWNNHQPNLVHFFGTLLTKESFADVTLVSSEGKKIPCHKMILSSCSPYFQRVFEGNPCKHPIVILKDIDYVDLQTIITFIYHGEVNISQDRISSILMTANSLQVKGLAEVPAGDLKKSSSSNRKRDRDIEDGVQQQQGLAHQASASSHLHPSNSCSTGDEADETSSPVDIPKKKLRKSASAAATCGSSAVSTNGEHSSGVGSLESGASTSRSVDETTSAGEGRTESSSSTARTAAPVPPPLQPGSHHLPGKSKSLDHIHDRDIVTLDSELSSGGFSESQTYEDASGGAHRAGYELDIADVKIEAVSDDGEIEFEDDEDEEDPYGHSYNLEFNEINQSYPNVPSSSSLFHNPVHQFGSSQLGVKCRRGRPLIRQPRIKRPDNETGGELCIDESRDASTEMSKDDDEEDYDAPDFRRVEKRRDDGEKGDSVTVPIVTVSQSSPTPPSSPVVVEQPETYPSSVKPFSKISSASNGTSSTTNSSSSTNNNNSSNSSSLLMVPSVVESVTTSTSSGSSSSGSTLSPHTTGGVHLVKQISQPLLPSHTTVLSSTSSHNNPVIRRQHSSPNPVPHHIVSAPAGTRLFPLTQSNPLKRGTFFQLLPADNNQHHHHHSSKDDESSPSPGNTIFLESTSLLQLVPTGDGTNRITISPAFTNVKDEKKECISSGDLSPEVTLTLKEESGAVLETSASLDNVPSPSPVVQRAGHCPALRPGPALGCNFCWNSVDECGRILRRKTKYHCPECHINLCIVPCFQEYHEKAEKKKARSKLGLPKPSSM